MSMTSSFSQMTEADRMVFMAQLFHNMWYDEDCYMEVCKLIKSWESKEIPTAVFYPEKSKNTED